MQEQTVGGALEREHREIDAGLESFADGLKQGEWRAAELGSAAAALRRHIYLEEVMLFPLLREAGLVGPVFVMIREHGEIWRALDEVEARNAEGTDQTAALEAYDTVMELLERHNEKEEVILYPATDRVLDPQANEQLHAFLGDGALPEGWICEGLRAA